MGIFGTGIGGAYVLGQLLREEKSGLGDLGPAPIGSDPWLRAEVEKAIARETGVDASGVVVDARDAVVTIRGRVANDDARERIERAARTVQGIKRLEVELGAR